MVYFEPVTFCDRFRRRGRPWPRFMQIPNAVKFPQYRTWDGYEEWLPMNTWRVLLEIAMGV
jgi:hypothetical protein